MTFPLGFLLTAEEVFGTRKPRRRSLTPALPSFVVLLQGELEKRGEGLNLLLLSFRVKDCETRGPSHATVAWIQDALAPFIETMASAVWKSTTLF